MATRIEFVNGNGITVVDEYEVVKGHMENSSTKWTVELTQNPQNNPGEALPITIALKDIVTVRPTHEEPTSSSPRPASGLGNR